MQGILFALMQFSHLEGLNETCSEVSDEKFLENRVRADKNAKFLFIGWNETRYAKTWLQAGNKKKAQL